MMEKRAIFSRDRIYRYMLWRYWQDPSFWMRIQRVIWSLLKRNPATAIAALTMEEIIQLNVATVFDANIVAKYNNGMFGLPPVMGFWQ